MTAHPKDCVCVTCILKDGEPCDARLCIATKGHAGEHVSVWQAPAILAKLLAIGVAKKIGGGP